MERNGETSLTMICLLQWLYIQFRENISTLMNYARAGTVAISFPKGGSLRKRMVFGRKVIRQVCLM